VAGGSPSRARHRARDLLVKALYQWQVTNQDFDELLEQFAETAEYGRADQEYFRELLAAVVREAEVLDRSIERFAVRGIEQLDSVGRSVLRLAFAELALRPDVPAKVVINEAVELAKRYGAVDTFRFVNAVVDKAAKAGRASACGDGSTPGGAESGAGAGEGGVAEVSAREGGAGKSRAGRGGARAGKNRAGNGGAGTGKGGAGEGGSAA
jgi:N utilization substance protein B